MRLWKVIKLWFSCFYPWQHQNSEHSLSCHCHGLSLCLYSHEYWIWHLFFSSKTPCVPCKELSFLLLRGKALMMAVAGPWRLWFCRYCSYFVEPVLKQWPWQDYCCLSPIRWCVVIIQGIQFSISCWDIAKLCCSSHGGNSADSIQSKWPTACLRIFQVCTLTYTVPQNVPHSHYLFSDE